MKGATMAQQFISSSQFAGLDAQVIVDAANAKDRTCLARVEGDGISCCGRAGESLVLGIIGQMELDRAAAERAAQGIQTVRWTQITIKTARPGSRLARYSTVWGVIGENLAPGQKVVAVNSYGEATEATIDQVIETRGQSVACTITR